MCLLLLLPALDPNGASDATKKGWRHQTSVQKASLEMRCAATTGLPSTCAAGVGPGQTWSVAATEAMDDPLLPSDLPKLIHWSPSCTPAEAAGDPAVTSSTTAKGRPWMTTQIVSGMAVRP